MDMSKRITLPGSQKQDQIDKYTYAPERTVILELLYPFTPVDSETIVVFLLDKPLDSTNKIK
jgi:hypothetical protein